MILSNSHSFKLLKIDGLGDVESDIQFQKSPFQDGSTFVGATLKEREITLEVLITGNNSLETQEKRIYLASVLNPKLGEGVLKYESENGSREIKAIPDHVPIFPGGQGNKSSTFQKALISLICPSPFWTTEDNVDQLVVWEGGMEFPLQLPTFFARQSESKAKILLNEGDVETPLRIEFNGPATSPIKVINKTSGEFIEINQDLLIDERLEINTAFGQKRVSKVLADGTKLNAFHFITLDSSFFQLEVGNNLIDYSTGADYERAGVTLTWRNKFLAV